MLSALDNGQRSPRKLLAARFRYPHLTATLDDLSDPYTATAAEGPKGEVDGKRALAAD
jgi:hypothetical protein